jgi:hypothetical protein
MDPVVTLASTDVPVEPGGQATVAVRVRNRSSIVEGFRLDVVGDAAAWATFHPAEVEVRPQEEAEALLVFAPPAATGAHAGAVPFGVRAVSQVDPATSAVAEGDLQVGSVAQSQVTITPVTSKGRFSARHRIEVVNWGNAPVRLALSVSDPDEAVGFLLNPDTLDLPIGTSGRARLRVRARKPMLRGVPVRRPFRVVARPVAPGADAPAPGPTPAFGYDPTQPSVDGAFEQRPVLGRGIIPLALGALAIAAAVGFMRSRGDESVADETAPPPVPADFVAEAVSHDSVRVAWQPGERVDTYTLMTVDPTTLQEARPTAVDVVEEIPGDLGVFTVGELTPATQYCFQLTAVRNGNASQRTPAACVDTLQLQGPGAPAAPGEVTVGLTDDGKALVSWEDASDGVADHVVIRNGSVVQVVTHPQSEAVVDLASGENCFQVQARQGEVTSAPAPDPCVAAPSTGDATTTTAAGGGGPVPSGADLGVIAVITPYPIEDVDALSRAIAHRDRLRGEGHPTAGVLDTSDFPALANPTGNYYYVFIPGFSSTDEAGAFCEANGFGACLTYDLR